LNHHSIPITDAPPRHSHPSNPLKHSVISSGGDAPENVNQLRDPYVFEDVDGSLYLLYSGCGEDAIGIALLEPVAPGDFEPDGDVDLHDLAALAGQWLHDSGILAADLNDSGRVDFKDFSIFADSWLECNLVPPQACWE